MVPGRGGLASSAAVSGRTEANILLRKSDQVLASSGNAVAVACGGGRAECPAASAIALISNVTCKIPNKLIRRVKFLHYQNEAVYTNNFGARRPVRFGVKGVRHSHVRVRVNKLNFAVCDSSIQVILSTYDDDDDDNDDDDDDGVNLTPREDPPFEWRPPRESEWGQKTIIRRQD